MSENTATLAFFRENHEFLFASRTPLTLDRFRRTQTSSTMEGLNVYLRGSMLGKAHPYHRRYSFPKQLETEFNFDPRTSFANLWQRDIRKDYTYTITDEGFEEEPALRARDITRQLEVNLVRATLKSVEFFLGTVFLFFHNHYIDLEMYLGLNRGSGGRQRPMYNHTFPPSKICGKLKVQITAQIRSEHKSEVERTVDICDRFGIIHLPLIISSPSNLISIGVDYQSTLTSTT